MREGDIVIDIGANKGFYTLFFSCYVGEKGKIISFEASPDNFKTYLQRIKSTWNLPNVLPLNFILGKSDSELVRLKKPDFFDDGTGFYFKKGNGISKAYSYTRKVDTLLGSLGINKVKMVKIDVEGAEVVVLSGATTVLDQTDFVLVEVSGTGAERFGTSIQQLYDLLLQRKFSYAYLISKSETAQIVLTKVHSATGNVLFSKRDIFV